MTPLNQADSTARRPVTIVEPGQGRSGELGGIGVVFKLWGEDTNGYVSVVEHTFAVGALGEPHRHTREDEYSIVTEGAIGFRCGDLEAVLEAGGYITKPRGQLHAMWNAGSTPARMIEIISPAGLEKLFRDIADLVETGSPTLEDVVALSANYGVHFEEPPWLPDLIKRYNLTPGAEG
jgi:quercetin dioxygenase-like cupin family protein